MAVSPSCCLSLHVSHWDLWLYSKELSMKLFHHLLPQINGIHWQVNILCQDCWEVCILDSFSKLNSKSINVFYRWFVYIPRNNVNSHTCGSKLCNLTIHLEYVFWCIGCPTEFICRPMVHNVPESDWSRSTVNWGLPPEVVLYLLMVNFGQLTTRFIITYGFIILISSCLAIPIAGWSFLLTQYFPPLLARTWVSMCSRWLRRMGHRLRLHIIIWI